MAKKGKTASPVDAQPNSDAAERRYRSTAEIRRDFFPAAPMELFETGHPRRSQEELIVRLDRKTQG